MHFYQAIGTPIQSRHSEPRYLTDDEIRSVAPSAFAIQPYERMSSKYEFVPTSVVIAGMRNHGFMPVKVQQSRTRIPGKGEFTKHMIRFRNTSSQIQAVGDSALEYVLVNSHDGTSAYDLSFGLHRLVCANGLMVSDGLVESIHVKHMGNIIEEVIRGTESLLLQAPKVTDAVSTWQRIQLSTPEQKLLAESALSLRYDEEDVKPTPEQALRVRRSEDNANDLWSVFNRVQENVVRGGLRTVDAVSYRRNRTREVKGIDQNIKLNRALWTLGDKMAQLKA